MKQWYDVDWKRVTCGIIEIAPNSSLYPSFEPAQSCIVERSKEHVETVLKVLNETSHNIDILEETSAKLKRCPTTNIDELSECVHDIVSSDSVIRLMNTR